MNTLPNELWPQIVGNDWQVYRGLLAVSKFARYAMKDPLRWKILLTVEVHRKKSVAWKLAGKYHRDNDLPAIIREDGSQEWFQHGKVHRGGDLPAITWIDGSQEWYHKGKCHRDGGLPSVVYPNGDRMWYQHGTLHRDGGLPAIIYGARS